MASKPVIEVKLKDGRTGEAFDWSDDGEMVAVRIAGEVALFRPYEVAATDGDTTQSPWEALRAKFN